jgi:hypothetical protein
MSILDIIDKDKLKSIISVLCKSNNPYLEGVVNQLETYILEEINISYTMIGTSK